MDSTKKPTARRRRNITPLPDHFSRPCPHGAPTPPPQALYSEVGMSAHYEQQLLDAISNAGLPPPPLDKLTHDGTFLRFGDAGKPDKPCWIASHELSNGQLVATFGDWRMGSSHTFKSWEHNGATLHPEEIAKYKEEYKRRKEYTETKQAKQHTRRAQRDAEIWKLLPQVGESEYLTRKHVGAYGIRFGADDRGRFVAVPMRDISGRFRAFQRYYDDGSKWFAPGTEKAAHSTR